MAKHQERPLGLVFTAVFNYFVNILFKNLRFGLILRCRPYVSYLLQKNLKIFFFNPKLITP